MILIVKVTLLSSKQFEHVWAIWIHLAFCLRTIGSFLRTTVSKPKEGWSVRHRVCRISGKQSRNFCTQCTWHITQPHYPRKQSSPNLRTENCKVSMLQGRFRDIPCSFQSSTKRNSKSKETHFALIARIFFYQDLFFWQCLGHLDQQWRKVKARVAWPSISVGAPSTTLGTHVKDGEEAESRSAAVGLVMLSLGKTVSAAQATHFDQVGHQRERKETAERAFFGTPTHHITLGKFKVEVGGTWIWTWFHLISIRVRTRCFPVGGFPIVCSRGHALIVRREAWRERHVLTWKQVWQKGTLVT